MKCMVVDGQGGRMGRLIIEELRRLGYSGAIYAIGTNSIATANMLKAGAEHGATGENPVVCNAADADVIIGPVGIVVANAILGEVTPVMAEAVGKSAAQKILLPTSGCKVTVAGTAQLSLQEAVRAAAEEAVRVLSA